MGNSCCANSGARKDTQAQGSIKKLGNTQKTQESTSADIRKFQVKTQIKDADLSSNPDESDYKEIVKDLTKQDVLLLNEIGPPEDELLAAVKKFILPFNMRDEESFQQEIIFDGAVNMLQFDANGPFIANYWLTISENVVRIYEDKVNFIDEPLQPIIQVPTSAIELVKLDPKLEILELGSLSLQEGFS